MSEHPPPPRLDATIDALLSTEASAEPQLDEGLLDERLLDALAEALAPARGAVDPQTPATDPLPGAPDGWARVAARLDLATPPPGGDVDWDAVAVAYRTLPEATPLPAAEPATRPQTGAKPRPRAWIGWAGGGLLAAAVAVFMLRPAPWTIHPDELRAPRIPMTVRGEAAAGPALLALAPGPGPQPAGLIALRLRVQSARAVDHASLRLRSLRGEGRLLDPAEGPTWSTPTELQVGLRLPPGLHPIEISVMDDLQREGALVVELEVR